MRVAIVEDGGDILSVRPDDIKRVLPLGRGSVVTLAGGHRFASTDSVATLRRRLRALPRSAAGRGRALRRLWVADIRQAARWLHHRAGR